MDNKLTEERKKELNHMIWSIDDDWYTGVGYTEEQIEFIFYLYNLRKEKNRYEQHIRKWFTYIPLNKYLPRFIEMFNGKKVLNFSGMYFESGVDVVAIIDNYLKEHSEDAELFEDIEVVDLAKAVIGNSINTLGGLVVLCGARLISDKPFDINISDKTTRVLLKQTRVDSQSLNFNGIIENLTISDYGQNGDLRISYNGEEIKHL